MRHTTGVSLPVLLLLFWLALVPFVLYHSQEDVIPHQRSGRQPLSLFGLNKTIDGGTVSGRFCDYYNGTCDFVPYAKHIAIWFAPGAVLAVLSLLACPLFLIGRFVCNTFGGRRRTKGICCVGMPEDFRGYSGRSIFVAKFGVFLCFLAAGGFIILGFLGDKSVSSGLVVLERNLITAGEELIQKAQGVIDAVGEASQAKSQAQEFSDVIAIGNTTLNLVKGYSGTVAMYDHYRFIGTVSALSLCAALLLLGSLGAICNWRCFALLPGLAGFIGLFICWMIFSVHFGVYAVTTDACVEIDLFTAGSKETAFSVAINCTVFDGMREHIQDLLDEGLHTACDTTAELCSRPQVECHRDLKANCTEDNLVAFLTETNLSDFLLGCYSPYSTSCPYNGTAPCDSPFPCFHRNVTILECAEGCLNPDLRNQTQHINSTFWTALEYERIIKNQVLPLLSCSFFQDVVNGTREPLCETMVGGVLKISIASALIAFISSIGFVCMIRGYKRFRDDSGRHRITRVAPIELDEPVDVQIRGGAPHYVPQYIPTSMSLSKSGHGAISGFGNTSPGTPQRQIEEDLVTLQQQTKMLQMQMQIQQMQMQLRR